MLGLLHNKPHIFMFHRAAVQFFLTDWWCSILYSSFIFILNFQGFFYPYLHSTSPIHFVKSVYNDCRVRYSYFVFFIFGEEISCSFMLQFRFFCSFCWDWVPLTFSRFSFSRVLLMYSMANKILVTLGMNIFSYELDYKSIIIC